MSSNPWKTLASRVMYENAWVRLREDAVVRPDGTLQTYQPYGEEGLLIAEIDIAAATGLLARRCRTDS